jgi:hypothetical protein
LRGNASTRLWRELGGAGFFALRLPEAAGGVGLRFPEAVLLFEEAGRALLPGPLAATHLAAGRIPGAASGEAVVTAVDGELIEWLYEADHVVGSYESAEPFRSVDPLTPLRLALGGPVRTPSPEVVLLTSAQQLGSAGRTLELAVQHARAREQFGRPIGSFQAAKHLCADMLLRVEMARTAVCAAAVTGDRGETVSAKVLADEAAGGNAVTVCRYSAGASPGRRRCTCISSIPGCWRPLWGCGGLRGGTRRAVARCPYVRRFERYVPYGRDKWCPSVDIGLCPRRDLSRGGVEARLGYAPSGASSDEARQLRGSQERGPASFALSDSL